jgi:hypothetical protein
VVSRTWLAIPVMTVICAGLGAIAGQPAPELAGLAALGAALAAAVRAFAGVSPGAAIAGATAALLGVLAVLDLAPIDPLRAAVACAAGLFAIAELARPMPPTASPLPAIGAAALAGVLDPSFVALFGIAGLRYVRGPWRRPRWALALPVAGAAAVLLAVVAALGPAALAPLWDAWGGRGAAAEPRAVIVQAGDVIGPLSAIAAVCGLFVCATRGRYAAAAVFGVAAGAIALDGALGALGPASVTLAALGAGVGLGRFAALVRLPVGQAVVCAAAAFVLLVAPVWTLALRAG